MPSMQYEESSKYYISTDFYSRIVLLCTYVAEGWAFFATEDYENVYKYNSRTGKFYYFNKAYNSWDTMDECPKSMDSGQSVYGVETSYYSSWNENDFGD